MLKVTHKMLIETALDEVETLDVDDAVQCSKTQSLCLSTSATLENLKEKAKFPAQCTPPAACSNFG